MERLTYLFNQYTTKEASYAERLEFQELLQASKLDEQLKQLIDEHFESNAIEKKPLALTSSERMLAQIFAAAKSSPSQNIRKIRLWQRLTIAASITLAFMLGGYYYYNWKNVVDEGTIALKNDVAPGKMGATLTLANGKKIRLTGKLNGKLAEEAGVTISKTADGKLIYEVKGTQNVANRINTVSTEAGETYIVNLPDGTNVWLNAESSLSFDSQPVTRGKRKVRLTGEGYFEVAKDKLHPFIVETANQQVEVLGTHFNINSYADEPLTKTTLVEGSIKINAKNGVEDILKPGQQAILSTKQFNIIDVDTEFATAWKDNKFMFESAPIQEVMKMIERWYNVEIVYEANVPLNKFNGSVSRFENVSKVLQILESTKKVRFKVEGRRIFVNK